ncbi:MAG TPA: hypothetical protein VFA21_03855 [Pyrinomonadaceae bacterium]|nr:hypothetical protein [Pyrinomonadaceae bacterium]
MATLSVKQLQLAPLGAGDLIDRTVRLYRRHFMALIRACAPPVVVNAAGAIIMAVSVRGMGATGNTGRLFTYLLLVLLGLVIYVAGLMAQLIVMGGASRNLVMHLLWGEPVTARLIYRSVRSRFRALLGATIVIGFWLFLSLAVALAAAFILMLIAVILVGVFATAGAGAGREAQWLVLLIVFVFYLGAFAVALFIFFLLAGLTAYVPQVLMVEGKGVFASIGRSAELARGHVRRLMGMFLFTGFATYAAIMLLLVPLGWFAYLNGIDPFTFDPTRLPAWYVVSRAVINQLSAILLAPVYMMGLSLLYVDQRVRREGYDIELMAAQRFGEMPVLPAGVNAPVAPAIAAPQVKRPREDEEKFPGSVLGL